MLAEALSVNNVLRVLSLCNNPNTEVAGELFATNLKANKKTALEALYGIDLAPYKEIMGVGEEVEQTYDEEGNPTNVQILAALREVHNQH